MLPEGWKWLPLSEVANDTDRRNPTLSPDEHFTYVDIASIDSERGVIDDNLVKWLRGSDAPSRARKVIRKGNVIFATTRPYLKNIAIVPEKYDNQVCSTGFCVLSAKAEVSQPEYIFFATRSAFFIDQLIPKQRGANYPAVSDGDVFTAEIPIPYPDDPPRSLAEQRRIVARLEVLLGEVRELRRLQAEIEADVGRLMEAALAEVFREIENRHPGDRQIYQLTRITSGGTPLRSRSDFYEGGTIPWVKTGELRDGLVIQAEEYITAKGLENSSAKIFPVGTLLIAMYGQGQTRGRTGVLGIEAATNQASCAILPNPNEFVPAYLQYWFRHIYQSLRAQTESRGGNQPNLNQMIIRDLKPPLPNILDQKYCVSQLKTIETEVSQLQGEQERYSSLLGELEQSVLAQAFRGEL